MTCACFAGISSNPLISPPAAHTMASATSEAYPVLHAPSTLTGMNVAFGTTPAYPDCVRDGSQASIVPVSVPCQLLLPHLPGTASPGSTQSPSLPSPSTDIEGSETKSYPCCRSWKTSKTLLLSPLSKEATTTPLPPFHGPFIQADIPYGSE